MLIKNHFGLKLLSLCCCVLLSAGACSFTDAFPPNPPGKPVISGLTLEYGLYITTETNLTFEWDIPEDDTGVTGYLLLGYSLDSEGKPLDSLFSGVFEGRTLTYNDVLEVAANSYTSDLIPGGYMLYVHAFDAAGNVSDPGEGLLFIIE